METVFTDLHEKWQRVFKQIHTLLQKWFFAIFKTFQKFFKSLPEQDSRGVYLQTNPLEGKIPILPLMQNSY